MWSRLVGYGGRWRQHSQHSNAYTENTPWLKTIFNFGLLLFGFLTTIYLARSLINYAKYTSMLVAFSALMLQAVAAFDEVYERFHFVVSVLFFVSAGISCIIYFVEKRSILTIIAFLVGLLAWLTYWFGVYRAGVAVPEIISAVAVTLCIIQSALKIMGII